MFPSVAPAFWPLVGLAGVLGGVMRSPLTGVVFAVELTGRLDAVLPLPIGASSAYAVSVLILKRSVLTERLLAAAITSRASTTLIHSRCCAFATR